MTGFHKFHATGTMLSINFCSHFMGSRHTKVSTKPLPTGGIIKLTATAMQASELPRKIICCQQRIVLVAETQTSHLPKKTSFASSALFRWRQRKRVICQRKTSFASSALFRRRQRKRVICQRKTSFASSALFRRRQRKQVSL